MTFKKLIGLKLSSWPRKVQFLLPMLVSAVRQDMQVWN